MTKEYHGWFDSTKFLIHIEYDLPSFESEPQRNAGVPHDESPEGGEDPSKRFESCLSRTEFDGFSERKVYFETIQIRGMETIFKDYKENIVPSSESVSNLRCSRHSQSVLVPALANLTSNSSS